MGPTWILTNKKECVVSTPKRSHLNPKSHITKLNWAVFLNEFNKLYILLLFDSVVNIPFENQSLIFFAKVKCRFSYSVYDKPTKPLYFFNLYEWMKVEHISTYQRTTVKRIYLCLLACPPVKSVVDCHSVCFLGWGLVSLKKSGCLATCITQNINDKSLKTGQLHMHNCANACMLKNYSNS
jgi:hypothetical protein